MKLFSGFEAVKFPEENLIFVTHNGYLYYIYDLTYKQWQKYCNAGDHSITVCNYPDVSRTELKDAMQGIFPKRETDFMRLCDPAQLCIRDILSLLEEDYANYMSDHCIYYTVHRFLLESDIRHKSFAELKKILDHATALQHGHPQLLASIKELCFTIIGRDIFKKEIEIVDGHNSSSYFWIMPARVIDASDTNSLDNIAQMSGVEISIEENDVAQYLTPFLYRYFDDELEANKMRGGVKGFEWYLTHNFFTFHSMTEILNDMKDTIDALSSGRKNEYTIKLKIKRGAATNPLLYAKGMREGEIKEYNENRPKEDTRKIGLIIDFYHRFIYRMEYMMRVGKEKGYDLISFMGP